MITLLTGENSYGSAHHLNRLVADYDGDPERYDGSDLTTGQLPELFMGVNLFTTQRLVIIKDLARNKSLWTELSDWLEKVKDDDGQTDVVLVENEVDKRTKTYKWLQKHGRVYESKLLSAAEAVSWVQTELRSRGIEIDNRLAQYFVDYVGVDQWRLSSAMEKLSLSEKPVSIELIQQLIEPHPESSAFALLDALFQGKTKEAKGMIGILKRSEDPYQFFGLLVSQVYSLAGVVSGGARSSAAIAKDLGIHPFVASKLQPLARQYSKARLEKLVEIIALLDKRMKSSAGDPWELIERMLLVKM